ncbi:MAG: radical SAM protein [Nanoarchaeota archaeon]
MAEEKTILRFEELRFKKEARGVKALFLGNYHFLISTEDLQSIGAYSVGTHSLAFQASEKRARNKFNILLEKGFGNLISPNKRNTVYIHRNSGIPLMGTNTFGIVDRDTNVIEIKPMTGCNLNCTFCSVDEGLHGRKTRDFLVEAGYLVQEFEKVSRDKKHPVEAHIGGQCDSTLYPQLQELISGLREIKNVREISIDTNGVLLNENLVDALKKRGLTRIGLSIHSLDPQKARVLAGTAYNVRHMTSIAKYISKKMQLVLTPVLVPGVNEEDIEELILFSKELGCPIGIQNYLEYSHGRRPVDQMAMQEFNELLELWEKKFDVDLHLRGIFSFFADRTLEKPFRKGQRVPVKILFQGKYDDELICAAKDRLVTALLPPASARKRLSPGNTIIVKIVRDKHNIFKAVLAK